MYHFIVNPNSRSGHGKVVWEHIRARLQQQGIPYEIYFTKYPRHATALACDITKKDPNCTLVAIGGDGTVNEVVNGITNFSTITFGYIPTGSGNDFARSMGIPKDPNAALDILLQEENVSLVDVGVVEAADTSTRFIVSAGLGWDAAICHEAAASSIKKILNKLKLGKLTYVGIALRQIMLYQNCSMTVHLDEKETLHYPKAYFAAIMNQPYEGGGFLFAPKSSNSDGKFHVCLIGDLTKLKILMLLPTAYWGKHVHFKGVHMLEAAKIEIESSRPLPLHFDGEPGGEPDHAVFSMYPKQLRVITPEK